MPARKPFLLRIDPELWTELEEWAKDELRSVNGQIEFILRQSQVIAPFVDQFERL